MNPHFGYEIKTIINEITLHARNKMYFRFVEFRKQISKPTPPVADFYTARVSNMKGLPERLLKDAQEYDKDMVRMTRQMEYCKQVLTSLGTRCESRQEFADVLPDCILRNTVQHRPVYNSIPRLQEPFELIRDDPIMLTQVTKAVDILRTYQMLQLIDGE